MISKIFGLGEKDSIQKLSFSHLKYNLTFYFQLDKTKYINQIATRMNASYRVYGDVLLLNEMDENIYSNISIHETKRLNVLSYGRLYDRGLKENEIQQIQQTELDKDGKPIERKVTPYWNKYAIVEHRMTEWKKTKDRCMNCYQEFKIPVICQSCYRVKFCSKKCEKEYESYHYDDCFKSCQSWNCV